MSPTDRFANYSETICDLERYKRAAFIVNNVTPFSSLYISKAKIIFLLFLKVIKPTLKKYGVKTPLTCPFHKTHDKVGYFLKTKTGGRYILFKCSKCDLSFRTEDQFYQHSVENHWNETPKEANVCLADMCDILGCDFETYAGGAHCDPKRMEKLKHKCETLFRNCYEKQSIYFAFIKEFCEPLNCENTVHPVSKYV